MTVRRPHRQSPWQHYVNAALRPPGPPDSGTAGRPREVPGASAAGGRRDHAVPGGLERFGGMLAGAVFPATPATSRTATPRRSDVRLVPAALLVWASAAGGNLMEPAVLAGLCTALLAGSAVLLLRARATARRRIPWGTPRRSTLATLAIALLLAAVAAAHAAVGSSPRHGGAIAEAVDARADVAAELLVSAAPRRLRSPGSGGLADRWALSATLLSLDVEGRRIRADAKLVVIGGPDWEGAVAGQRIRTTGRLSPAGPGQAEAAALSASSAPRTLQPAGPWQRAPGDLRTGFTAAAGRFDGDARGLLPGMVTGDTSALDPELETAMKTVGMTHLTAVSGANCSLILGALLLAARSLRFRRAAAAAVCLAGLGLFVLLVGPDASVLRAAVMGGVGLVALAGGRNGRGLSFLCLAVIVLLLVEPALAGSFGFLLSVVATLGIVVAGRSVMAWFPGAVPRWLAAGLAVPLSAQAFCGPVVVLLQPQFSTYALPANLASAALVAPVTLLGTAAVPLVAIAPAAAPLPLGIAAAFAGGVGAIARYFAGLPGAALPWPEGSFGAATMALHSGVVLAALWLAFHPAAAVRLALVAHGRTVARLDRWEARDDARRRASRRGRRGLVDRSGRGTLRVCEQTSGRKLQWLLPRPNAPGLRRRRPPPGGT